MKTRTDKAFSVVLAFALVSLLVVHVPAISRADSISYIIFGASGSCDFRAGGSYTVIVTLNLSAPAASLKVREPYLPCDGSVSWNYPITGGSGERTVDFGGCISGSVTLLFAQFTGGCCTKLLDGPWAPAPGTPPVLIGCDNQPRFVIPPCSAPAPVLAARPTRRRSPDAGAQLGLPVRRLLDMRRYRPRLPDRYGTDPPT
jgi:hypothetical protein